MNFGLIPYRHRYCTYLYYSHTHTHVLSAHMTTTLYRLVSGTCVLSSASWTQRRRMHVLSSALCTRARAHSRTHAHAHVQDAGVDLDAYDIKTILVDPPRAGEESADSRARRSVRIIFLLVALSPCIPFGLRPPLSCMPLCCALWSAERVVVVCLLQDSTPVRWN